MNLSENNITRYLYAKGVRSLHQINFSQSRLQKSVYYLIITQSRKDRTEEAIGVNKNIARKFNELCKKCLLIQAFRKQPKKGAESKSLNARDYQ